jgi:3-oxoacyl-(acyl-carrier-protein) synthase
MRTKPHSCLNFIKFEQIQLGKQDVVFAGGGEELNWSLTMLFDAMGALSSKYNENPTQASRAFDVDRDGFVISGGGGALVLESLEHAQTRGATILAELTGYGATSDGHDMVAPSGHPWHQIAWSVTNLALHRHQQTPHLAYPAEFVPSTCSNSWGNDSCRINGLWCNFRWS